MNLKMQKAKENIAKRNVGLANTELRQANGDPQRIIMAKQKLASANRVMENAIAQRKIAETKGNVGRDETEPEEVKLFRASLLKCPSVAQLFDPWFVDRNARNDVAPTPNSQLDPNEKLHGHHLHITVCDPKIL